MPKPTDEFDFSRQRWEHLIDSYIFDDCNAVFLRGDRHSSGRCRCDRRGDVYEIVSIAAKRDGVTVLLDVASITPGGATNRDDSTDSNCRCAGVSRVDSRFTHIINPFII